MSNKKTNMEIGINTNFDKYVEEMSDSVIGIVDDYVSQVFGDELESGCLKCSLKAACDRYMLSCDDRAWAIMRGKKWKPKASKRGVKHDIKIDNWDYDPSEIDL